MVAKSQMYGAFLHPGIVDYAVDYQGEETWLTCAQGKQPGRPCEAEWLFWWRQCFSAQPPAPPPLFPHHSSVQPAPHHTAPIAT